MSLAVVVTVNSPTTLKVSCTAANNSAGQINTACTNGGAPGNATMLTAIRIG
jgi:hypothetical protein